MGLSIKTKIALATAGTVLVVTVFVGMLLRSQQTLVRQMRDIVQQHAASTRMAEGVKYAFVLHDDLIFRYLATDDPQLLVESQRARQKARDGIGHMQDSAQSKTEMELLLDLQNEMFHYDAQVKSLVQKYQSRTRAQKRTIFELLRGEEDPNEQALKNKKEAIALMSAEGRARLTRIYSLCEKLTDISRSRLEEAEYTMRSTVQETKITAMASALFVLIGTVIVGALLTLSLLGPLKRLLRGVQHVTSGELNLELTVESADEIGRLTQEFNAMIRNLREKQDRLMRETVTDPLTELFNYRYFQSYLKNEILRAARYNHPFALLILDVDHFKNYNDRNGHLTGNLVLREVATLLNDSVRGEGLVARYGGEEFVVVLPETEEAGAFAVAERLRRLIEQSVFPGEKGQPGGRLTVSIGGAHFPLDGVTADQLIEKADRALYNAKNSGRNLVSWSPRYRLESTA